MLKHPLNLNDSILDDSIIEIINKKCNINNC